MAGVGSYTPMSVGPCHATVEKEGKTMRRLAGILVVAGLVVVFSAGGAWAGTCPVLAKQANELLNSTSTNT